MKFFKFFPLAILSTVLNCFCSADHITKKQDKDSSLLYTYRMDSGEDICSLVLKPGSERGVLVIDRITLTNGYDVSYIRSLMFNVINSYKSIKFLVHISGDSSSSFRDTDFNILDKDVSKICKSLGFEINSDKGKNNRRDIFCANSVTSNKRCYIDSEEGELFKYKAKLKNAHNIPVVDIRDLK